MWTHSGIPEVDRLLRDGVAAMERRDFPRAEELFAHVIEIAPDFAEGWNKRATVRYLAEDFAGAIADCGETIARKPRHFGALSGQGLCHMALGQHREAADALPPLPGRCTRAWGRAPQPRRRPGRGGAAERASEEAEHLRQQLVGAQARLELVGDGDDDHLVHPVARGQRPRRAFTRSGVPATVRARALATMASSGGLNS